MLRKLRTALLAKVALILLLIIGAYVFVTKQYSELSLLHKHEIREELALKQLRHKIDRFNTKSDDIASMLDTWSHIANDSTEFKGLQLSKAKEIIGNVKSRYHIPQLDVKLSKPAMLTGKYHGDKVGVESTVLKLRVGAYSDLQIFYALYDLLVLLPGYPKVIKFSLKKIHDLTETNLHRITTEQLTLVLAEIDIKWSDFKDL
jgi:hypothetical protein